MEHLLDYPAWNALLTGNKNLSLGNEHVKYFPKEIAPFVGMSEFGFNEFQLLDDNIPVKRELVIIYSEEIEIPKPWIVKVHINALQMVYDRDALPADSTTTIVPLKNKDVPQMVSLTTLTHPGPFSERTIEFGNYEGIFNNGQLISMAGQRMHPGKYVEISAVCTHPDHLGKGYASQLIQSQVCKIKSNSEIPFLHVRSDKENAIRLYKALGFEERKQMEIYVFHKD
ncbi:MAG: GNAT family N-acetyltransferase [Ginsengibacter sp.]